MDAIGKAIATLRTASRPLIIVGKGAAYARAEVEVRRLVEASGIPYLATPMGKGVIPDDHPSSIGAARSLALQVRWQPYRLDAMLAFGIFVCLHKLAFV